MDLILWRHAEAEDIASTDLARALTTRGRKQAQNVAKWLRMRLPDDALVLASPAVRTIQTAETLSDQYRVVRELAPNASADNVLDAAGWPRGIAQTVVIVGHQPTLGHVAARLLGNSEASWPLRKAGVWWIASRERDGDDQAVLRAAMSPDLV
ncbi:phosphohistidine phosphatase SixA [Paraburkholderia xenovorans LB400]|jgi:phosphohistidine phosphatase|uniref:Phosphohistidine phosphatase, SixA n=1 Tax=Paraburkholderia xenovorans (strain LB400) TaxID=266265 RepID=Q13W62_PARXL|nr:phosphohistidine phosphatase SixA [Paraburkholderia xenovorans]ABE31677.1 phosphohistidine phosphatase, SixA [Paraburkholderia xenovorans LB400]AIP29587.1 phosphohistidine phosphatase SixA [Paraburkholderia xenovorans LB400]NPT39263.1 phosphohistidine phosphatase SixA [Paraburkholderia xenovorans]